MRMPFGLRHALSQRACRSGSKAGRPPALRRGPGRLGDHERRVHHADLAGAGADPAVRHVRVRDLGDVRRVRARQGARGQRTEAATTLARNVVELRDQAPGLLHVLTPAIDIDDPDELEPILTTYSACRATHAVPGLLDALADLRRPGDHRTDLHIRLYGDTLFVNGVRILDPCPRPMREVLAALAADTARTPIPYRSSSDLAERTGRSPAAIVQTIRRLRLACTDRLHAATGHTYDKEALVQGRPGYRLNPATVTTIHVAP